MEKAAYPPVPSESFWPANCTGPALKLDHALKTARTRFLIRLSNYGLWSQHCGIQGAISTFPQRLRISTSSSVSSSTIAKPTPQAYESTYARPLVVYTHPVLSRMLQSNSLWAAGAVRVDLDYFKQGEKGQSYKVRRRRWYSGCPWRTDTTLAHYRSLR